MTSKLESDRLSSRGIFPDSVEYTIAPRIARPIGGETLLSSNPLRSTRKSARIDVIS